jgi:hypothetical protein
MKYFLDFFDSLNGFWLGVFSSILASVFLSLFIIFRDWINNNRLYNRWNGYFQGYTITDEHQRIVSNIPVSEIKMKYLGKNKIQIEVTDLNNTNHNNWIGIIYMITANSGTMTWRYKRHLNEDLGNSKHLYGIKRVTTSEIGGEWMMYLMEEKISHTSEHFGNEVIRRQAQ